MQSIIIPIICAILDMTIQIIFYNRIFQKRKENVPFFLFLCSFIAVELAGLLIPQFVNSLPFIFQIIFNTFFSFATTFALTYLYYGNLKSHIFAAVSFQLFAVLSEFIVYLIIDAASKINLAFSSLYETVYIPLSTKFILFLCIILCNLLFYKKRTPSSYNVMTLLTPLVSIVIMTSLISVHTQSIIESILNVSAVISIIVLNITNYILLDNLLKVQTLQKKEQELNQQLSFQTKRYEQISASYKNIRSILHDTKKHFFFLLDCVHNEQYYKIKPYIMRASDDLEKCYNRINTGNLVIDAFVSNQINLADEANICFQSNIHVDNHLIRIDDYDLCIILGNLLDNAMKASEKIATGQEKCIVLNIFTTSHEFVIHIKNRYVKQNNNKSEDNLHGYGLQNVQKIVNKYYGNYSVSTKDNIYEAIITIPIIINT